MQYLKHSTTEVTITALSEGLDAARSLDRLKQTHTHTLKVIECDTGIPLYNFGREQ